jgi:hypothetical protein
MSPSDSLIPLSVRGFLRACITSCQQLEVLLLLHRSRIGWASSLVAHTIGIPDLEAEAHLHALADCGLLRLTLGDDPLFHYNPSRPQWAAAIDTLVDLMPRAGAEILELVRSSSVRA